jgi:hypothetical protein
MAAEVMQIENDYDKRQGREWPFDAKNATAPSWSMANPLSLPS